MNTIQNTLSIGAVTFSSIFLTGCLEGFKAAPQVVTTTLSSTLEDQLGETPPSTEPPSTVNPPPATEPPPVVTIPDAEMYAMGKMLYQQNNCTVCHGALDVSNVRGVLITDFDQALLSVGQMSGLPFLSALDRQKIVFALNHLDPNAAGPTVPDPVQPNPPPVIPDPPPVANTSLTCTPGSDPGFTPGRRLSKLEYTNTLTDLLQDNSMLGRFDRVYGSYYLVGSLAPLMGSLPDDDQRTQFSRLDKTQSLTLLEGQFIVAQAAAKEIAHTSKLNRYAGSCAAVAAPTAACVNSFITSFGKRALRRPLKADEVVLYKNIYDQYGSSSPKSGFEAVLEAFLMSPQFLMIIEVEGPVVAGKPHLLQLTDYEIASRLSYMLMQTMPTASLFAAADAKKLTTDPAAYEAEVNKIMAPNPNNMAFGPSARSHPLMMSPMQRTYMDFYKEWLKIGATPRPEGSATMTAFMNVYGNNAFNWKNLDTDQDWAGVNSESNDFMFRLTFMENKKFSDLLTDDSAVLISQVASNYYQMGTVALDQQVRLPNRAGILTRAPFLTTGTDSTSPILRGAFIRRNLLCDNLPSPDPDALPDRSLESPEMHPDISTRDRYAAKTSGSSCIGCHSQINPLGFAFEDFDSLGRNRAALFEPVFKMVGDKVTLLNQIPVNARVNSLNFTNGDGLSVNGGVQLSHALAESEKANTCFVRQIFRYTASRMESEGDNCMMQKMYSEMNTANKGISGLIRSIPFHPHFKIRNKGN